jgi:endonuclease YncB( thermonuclease family)
VGRTYRTFTRRGAALGLIGLAGCSGQPDLVAGEQGRIARINDGDVIGLDTGLKVRLIEVEAPAPGYQDRKDQPFAAEAREILSFAGMGREAHLWYGGLSRDDYGRALAHVIARDETGADVWLNGYLVRQGAARIRTWPDNARRARKLLALENEARSAKRGLWALDHWRVRGCDDLLDAPNFAIVEGQLASFDQTSADTAAHLSSTGIRLEGGDKLGPPDIPFDFSAGSRLRVRGRIDTRTGAPLIRITHWAQVEALDV